MGRGTPGPCPLDFTREILGRCEAPSTRPVGADEFGIAEAAHRVRPVLLATRPQVAAGEAAEHRRHTGIRPFALEGIEDFLDRVSHKCPDLKTSYDKSAGGDKSRGMGGEGLDSCIGLSSQCSGCTPRRSPPNGIVAQEADGGRHRLYRRLGMALFPVQDRLTGPPQAGQPLGAGSAPIRAGGAARERPNLGSKSVSFGFRHLSVTGTHGKKATRPCMCGYLGHSSGRCRCTPDQVLRYRKKISGPLLDRIDIQVEVPDVPSDDLTRASCGESSSMIRERVEKARAKMLARQGKKNARLSTRESDKYCAPDEQGATLVKQAISRLGLSARG